MMLLRKKIFSLSTLTLLVALSLSAIAAWYSILGLTAIFAAAVVPIIIMGSALEVAKVVTTVWLHRYWDRATIIMRLYLVPSVIALAILTSMGIFGFLSKAHMDQGIVSGDVQSKLSLYDEKIKIAKENIDVNRKGLKQLDEAVDQVMGRSSDEKGADKAVSIRRSQSKERTRLLADIEAEQKNISRLNEERAPIAAENRKVEAEVGPIKYIAALLYGDNPDANLLERAVRWVIILIVFVFDPLALTLVLASTSSYKWIEEEDKLEDKLEDNVEDTKEPESEEISEELESTTYKVITEYYPVTPEEDEAFNAMTPKKTIEEQMADTTEPELDEGPCPACGTTMLNASGIGPYCPNKECEVLDGALLYIEERAKNENNIQPNDVELHDIVGTELPETHSTDASENQHETVHRLDAVKIGPVEKHEQAQIDVKPVDIKTTGTTLSETGGGYIQFEGKSIHRNALASMRPDLFTITADSTNNQINTNFGTQFPKISSKGDIFVRVDMLPNRVFKFDSSNWIEIAKTQSDSYLYDDSYIQYLITKIDSGEYDVDLLSENEKSQIETYLKSQNT